MELYISEGRWCWSGPTWRKQFLVKGKEEYYISIWLEIFNKLLASTNSIIWVHLQEKKWSASYSNVVRFIAINSYTGRFKIKHSSVTSILGNFLKYRILLLRFQKVTVILIWRFVQFWIALNTYFCWFGYLEFKSILMRR